MSLDTQDQAFITKSFLLVTLGSLVVVGGLMLAFSNYEVGKHVDKVDKHLVKVDEHLQDVHPYARGDTPVVLIGDSLKFKQQATPWNRGGSSGQFYVNLDTPVTLIVLKSKGTDATDDGKPGTDAFRVDVSNNPNWEVDEYAASGLVASITPTANNTLVLQSVGTQGTLCFDPTTITYITNTDCTHPVPGYFDHVSVTIKELINGELQPVLTGTIACIDQKNNQKGKCRIVFRE
jgi:hypothetical protein